MIFGFVLLSSWIILSKPKGLPPGPVSLPLIGSYFLLRQMQRKKPFLALFEASKKYGNIFSFKIGSQLVVALHGFDAIHEALVKQADVFSDRPVLPDYQRQFKDGIVKGILFRRYHDNWKTLRRFTLQTLRDFGVGKTSIEHKIMSEIDAASSVVEATDGKPFKITHILQRMVGNVIYGIVFGKRFEYEDPEFDTLFNMTKGAISERGSISMASFLPLWMVKLLARKAHNSEKNRAKIFQDIEKYILKQVNEHEDSFNENNIDDFLDLYIKVSRQSKQEASDVLTKDNIIRVILELFVAGVETTFNTLDWAFLFMSENPDIQEKCQKEIDENVGQKIIDSSDRIKLKYINATISEVQRHANIAPLALPHYTKEATTLLGFNIAKHTVITPNLYSASMDPRYWREPHRFYPDRFLDDSGTLVKTEALIPFSAGPRTCLGEPLARMEIFLIFANMLQRFTFSRENPDTRHSLELIENQYTSAPCPYKIKIQKRHSN